MDNLIARLAINTGRLDEKKPHTTYKISYVTAYAEKWLRIIANWDKSTNINFIDCMSNAGIYTDNDLGTAPKVLLIMCEEAKRHPDKQFSLFVNDIDPERIEICRKVCKEISDWDTLANVDVFYSSDNVNSYLESFSHQRLNDFGSSTLVFVDPYNAGVLHFNALTSFIDKFYCEVLFNWFSSDHIRNAGDRRIAECFEGISIPQGYDAARHIAEMLSQHGKMKYKFNYPFRNTNNAELYQIIYITPSPKGLEALKETLWDVFQGKEFHRTIRNQQRPLFDKETIEQLALDAYVNDAQERIKTEFDGMIVDYNAIELFLLENTMLKGTQVIKSVLKPLIANNEIKKCGFVTNANNYKDDKYEFLNKGSL